VHELDGVRVPELVGCEPASDSCVEREVAQLDPCGAIGPRPAAGWAVDHAEQRPDRQSHAISEPGLDRRLIPTSE
jgi:hypothetical protein